MINRICPFLARNRYSKIYILLLCHHLFLQFQLSHGIHLSKTISFTAMDLAKSAGMDEDDISAAVLQINGNGSEEGEVEVEEVGDGGSGVSQKVQVDETLPHITEIVKNSPGPVLPLCCSKETEDVVYYQCGSGGSVTSDEKFDGGTQKRSWTAPRKLVSSKSVTEFRLEKSVLSCQYATFAASISLNVNSTETHFFYPDGNLRYENEFYRIDEYCISSIRKDQIFLQICQANCSDPMTPCVHKCCGLDEVYSFGNDDYPTGCQPVSKGLTSASSEVSDIRWKPTFYHDLSYKLSRREMSKLTPHLIQRYPSNFKHKCKTKKTTVFPFGNGVADYLSMVTGKSFKNLEFRLRKDGWLLYPFRDSSGHEIPVINRILNYCIDGAQHYGETMEYANLETQTVLFLCSGGVDEAFENSIIEPESDEISTPNNKNNVKTSGGRPSSSANLSSSSSPSALFNQSHHSKMNESESMNVSSSTNNNPSSVEIYTKSKQKPHVLYQLFQLHSHTRPPNIVLNHNTKKLTKIKKRRPSIVNLFPNHPNRTKIVTRKKIKKPKFTLPACCAFPSDVNDGQTHHCRNRMVDLTIKAEQLFPNSNITHKPIWKVPGYFMTNGQDSPFGLETSPVTCSYGQWQLQGFIHNFQKNASSQNALLPLPNGISTDGYLKYDNEFFRPGEYCINGLSPRIIEVLICKPNCNSKETPCIPKCCGMDETYSLGLDTGFRGCSPMTEEFPKFKPKFFRNMHHPLSTKNQEKILPHFIQRYPPNFQKYCYRGITLAFPYSDEVAAQLNPYDSSEKGPTFKSLQFRFRNDGKLMYAIPDDDGTSITGIYDRKEYCVDLITDYGIDEPFRNHENQTILFICASQSTSHDENY